MYARKMAFRLAVIQMAVSANKMENLRRAKELISQAATSGAQLITLPECFNSPYGTQFFKEYAEAIPDISTETLSSAAKENSVWVVGGSIPESCDGKLFNTCTVWDANGQLVAKHRKVHLFDIDVPGKIRFQESEVLSPGNELTIVNTPFCKLGIGICYDIRFPEMAMCYAADGCQVLIYPGAFNMTTGPLHWELLQRSRALDNQVFVATCSPATDKEASYTAWGHSMVVDPWGAIVDQCQHAEQIILADINLEKITEVKQSIPVTHQKRKDIYSLKQL